jgi:hypothetical protein
LISSSWPGLTRPSTSCLLWHRENVDARDKPGHDELMHGGVSRPGVVGFQFQTPVVQKTWLRYLAACNARGLRRRCPLETKEGAGNAGCTLHPRSHVPNCAKETHMSIQVQSEALRHSPRNGFTAYATLSPATNSSCHRHRRIEGFVAPGWARKNLRRFDTSNGCQDHTVLPYASAPFVCAPSDRSQAFRPTLRSRRALDAAASTASRPNVRDDGQRPSPWGRDGEAYSSDLPDGRSGIFFARGLDRANHVERIRKIGVLAQRSWRRFVGRFWYFMRPKTGDAGYRNTRSALNPFMLRPTRCRSLPVN